MNLVTLMTDIAAQRPDQPAMIGADGNAVTFGDVQRWTGDLATRLAGHGIGKGDFVLMLEPPSPRLYPIVLALFHLGAAAIVPDPSALRAHVAHAGATLRPKAMIGVRKAHALRLISRAVADIPVKLSTDGWLPFTRRLDTGRQQERVPVPAADVPPEQVALVTQTSGTTGAPKGIPHSHGKLWSQIDAFADVGRPAPGTRGMNVLTPSFPLLLMVMGLTAVMPRFPIDQPGRIPIAEMVRQIDEHAVDHLYASPIVLERLLAAIRTGAAAAPTRLTTVFTGGAPIWPDRLLALQEHLPDTRLVAVLGASEADPMASYEATDLTPGDIRAMQAGQGLPGGRFIDHLAGVLIDPDRTDEAPRTLSGSAFDELRVPAGVVGEITVSGQHVLTRYIPEDTDAAAGLLVDGVIWRRTGDMAMQTEDGRLFLVGRRVQALLGPNGPIWPFQVTTAARSVVSTTDLAALSHNGSVVLALADPVTDRPTLAQALSRFGRIEIADDLGSLPVDRRHNSKTDLVRLRQRLDKMPRR